LAVFALSLLAILSDSLRPSVTRVRDLNTDLNSDIVSTPYSVLRIFAISWLIEPEVVVMMAVLLEVEIVIIDSLLIKKIHIIVRRAELPKRQV
jgi:hypothetical protein